jgi:ABC-type hemin transport system ATPase subunit
LLCASSPFWPISERSEEINPVPATKKATPKAALPQGKAIQFPFKTTAVFSNTAIDLRTSQARLSLEAGNRRSLQGEQAVVLGSPPTLDVFRA